MLRRFVVKVLIYLIKTQRKILILISLSKKFLQLLSVGRTGVLFNCILKLKTRIMYLVKLVESSIFLDLDKYVLIELKFL